MNTEKTTDQLVAEYLETQGIVYSVQYRGEKRNACNGTSTMDEWLCTFSSGKSESDFRFYTGLGHRVDTTETKLARIALKNVNRKSIAWEQEVLKKLKPKAPSTASVLHSLILDSQAEYQSFSEWCADFGYSNDSIKAEATFDACRANARDLRAVFKHEQIAQLQTLLEAY